MHETALSVDSWCATEKARVNEEETLLLQPSSQAASRPLDAFFQAMHWAWSLKALIGRVDRSAVHSFESPGTLVTLVTLVTLGMLS